MVAPGCARGRAGFTLLEVMICLVLLVLIGSQAITVMRATRQHSSNEITAITTQREARMILDRIVYSVISSNRETLQPEKDTPLCSSTILYQGAAGIESGAILWGDPESIGVDEAHEVVWRQSPGTEAERHVVWGKSVRELLEGEVLNGRDDNGNGLIDETGLSFTIDGNKVTIGVCLERVCSDGRVATESVSTTVTCRNLGRAR